MPFDDAIITQVIDDLANALQSAVLVSPRLQTALAVNADEASTLHQALTRAVATLRQLQPR